MRSRNCRKKGGVISFNPANISADIHAVLHNSRWRIFTNNSISCITIVCTLNDGYVSPFRHVRIRRWGQEVRVVLIKLFPINTDAVEMDWIAIPGRAPHNGIEIGVRATVRREYETQREIHNASLLSPFSFLNPICPDVLGYEGYVLPEAELRQRLDPRPGRTLDQEVNEINTAIGVGAVGVHQTPVNGVRMIVMEFMDGFDTYYNAVNLAQLPPDRRRFLDSFSRFRLDHLHSLGFVHIDFHARNRMVNINLPHFTEPGYEGELQIIDFGRTRRMTAQEQAMNLDQQFLLEGGVAPDITYQGYTIQQFIDSETQLRADIIQWIGANATAGLGFTYAQWEARLRAQNRMGGSRKLKIIKKRKTTKKTKLKKIKGGYIDKMHQPNPFNEAEKMSGKEIVKGPFNKPEKMSDEDIAKLFNNKSIEEITELLTNQFSKEKYLDAEVNKIDGEDASQSKTDHFSKEKYLDADASQSKTQKTYRTK